jgi:hypothetical protein
MLRRNAAFNANMVAWRRPPAGAERSKITATKANPTKSKDVKFMVEASDWLQTTALERDDDEKISTWGN